MISLPEKLNKDTNITFYNFGYSISNYSLKYRVEYEYYYNLIANCYAINYRTKIGMIWK